MEYCYLLMLKLKKVSQLPKLNSLTLIQCSNLNDSSLLKMTELSIELTSLNIFSSWKITNNGLEAIAEICNNMSSLVLSGCSQISNNGVLTIFHKCNDILETVNLYMNTKIDSVVLDYIVGHFKNLKSLNLAMCTNIDKLGLTNALSHIADLKQLEYLNLRQTNLVDTAFLRIREELPNLKILNINGCKELSKYGFMGSWPSEVCNFTCTSTKIDNNGLNNIQEYCKKMERLVLWNCHGITDVGMSTILQMKSLRNVDISHTSITEKCAKIFLLKKELENFDCVGLDETLMWSPFSNFLAYFKKVLHWLKIYI